MLQLYQLYAPGFLRPYGGLCISCFVTVSGTTRSYLIDTSPRPKDRRADLCSLAAEIEISPDSDGIHVL
jgi:hypothetical protein